MKKSIFILLIICISAFQVKSQIERIDSISVANWVQTKQVYFAIYKSQFNKFYNYKSKYKAFLVVNKRDTINLYHDSIIIVNNIPWPFPTVRFIIKCKRKTYEFEGIENYIFSSATNIWFICKPLSIGNNCVHHDFYSFSKEKKHFYKPDIYTEALDSYIPKGQDGYVPDSVIIKQNRKKNKFIIPYW